MDQVVIQQNGGVRKVYEEVDEDGTVREYFEEKYVIEGTDDTIEIPEGSQSSEIMIIKDEDDMKIYRQHIALPDGREMINTTTITIDENGEQIEETVTEIVEESEELEDGEDEPEEVGVQNEQPNVEDMFGEGQPREDNSEQYEPDEPEYVEVIPEDPSSAENYEHSTPDNDADVNVKDEDGSVGRRLNRRISYEEFKEQYTEYKPPKRYEKKQNDKAADKAAPKISIMTTGTVTGDSHAQTQGLPNNDLYSTSTSGEQLTSPRSSQGEEDSTAEDMPTNQPTRTQGTVIRRTFDQLFNSLGGSEGTSAPDNNKVSPSVAGFIHDKDWMDHSTHVDPANIVRADDKPDLEAELPARGMSRSMKERFQSMEKDNTTNIDFTKPVRQERPRTGLYGYEVSQAKVSVGMNGDSTEPHHEPEFEGGEKENTPEVRTDVVRESDRYDQEELPESGYARNLLSKFKQLEQDSQSQKKTEYRPSGIGSKPSVTPLRSSSSVEVVRAEEYQEPEPEGGEYENQPETRTDVVRESDTGNMEEELPSIGVTKNLVSVFRQKEEETKITPVYKPSGAGYRPPRVTSRHSSSSSTEPHHEPEFEGGEKENIPEVRTDVVRESDRNDQEELPEPGLARGLKDRYRELTEQQRRADYVEHRPSGVASKATPTPLGTANRHSRQSSISSDDAEVRVEPQLESGEYENTPVRRTDVIREEDRLDEEELPEAGYTKNLLSQFKTLESQKTSNYKPSGVGSKPTPTPLWPPPCGDVITEETEFPPPEGGEYENQPVTREDVIREHDETLINDFPEEGFTQRFSMHYRQLLENQEPDYVPSGISQKATPSKLHIMAGKSAYVPKGTDSDAVINDEVEEQRIDAGEFENTPVTRDDVVNERVKYEEELPEQGLARNLTSKFSSIEEQNKSVSQYKPSGVASKPTPTPLRPTSAVLNDSVSEDSSTQDILEVEGGEYENIPEVNHNVVRSSDSNESDYIPTAGAARSLLDKFKQLENRKSDKVEHRPSKVASLSTPTPLTLKR